jgi:glucokinase
VVGTEEGGPASAIGLDVGGTKIAGYLVDGSGGVLRNSLAHTPADDAEATLAAMAEVVRTVGSERARAIGIGIAGMIEFGSGVMRYGPNLPFRDLPLRDRMAEATRLPCLVDNDANVAAWGEYRVGAGRGTTDMLLVTVGTGIGGGIVSGGRMFRGAHGLGAEIGHIIVEPNGPPCGCGNRGCWEQVASGRAIDRLGRHAAEASPTSLMVELAGGDPTGVTGPVVVQAAHAGDTVAIGVLGEVGRRLGEGIAGMVNVLDSQIVVVGGGAISAGDLLLDPAREAFTHSLLAPEYRPEVRIVAAQMGNAAGGIGAGLLALDELVTAPNATG